MTETTGGRISERIRALKDDDAPLADLDADRWRAGVAERLFGTSMPPQRVGRYEIIDRVGEGATGVVYVANDPELDRQVAIKLLRPEVARSLPDSPDWLAREARTLAKLSHPNVVPIYDVGRHQGQVFISLEYVPGDNLRAWLKAKPSLPEIVRVMGQAAQGLAAAHAAGLVHRDFKPENVLLGEDGRVRVSDFGIALPTRSVANSGTESGDITTPAGGSETPSQPVAGTPAYMAPEQFLGDAVDAQADQFSFCVVLHEAVYGRRPFRGSDRAKLAATVIAGRRTIPSSAKQPPRWLESIIARGLAVRREQRYSSMTALFRDLERGSRRRMIWPIGIAAAATAVVTAAALGTTKANDPCLGAPEALAKVWNPQVERKIASVFDTSDVPEAQSLWLRVKRDLDAYAAAWVDANRQACEANPPKELVVQRLFCLQSRLLEIESLLALYSDADAQVVQNAAIASASLRPPTECLFPKPAPKTERPSDKTRAEIRRRIAQGHAEGNVGRPRAGLALAREAARVAQDIGDRALEAEALLIAAQFERQLLGARDRPDAESTAYAAVLAAEAARRPDLIARAQVEYLAALVNVGEIQRALEWEPKVRSAVAAASSPAALVGQIEHTIALALNMSGDDDGAQQAVARALDVLDDGDAASREGLVKALNLAGEFRFQRGDYRGALPYYERTLAVAVEGLGARHVWAANGHGNLAEVFFVEGDYAQAKEHFEIALDIRRNAFDSESIWVSHSLGHVGDVALAMGAPQTALETYEEALAGYNSALPTFRDGLADDGVAQSLRPTVYRDLQASLLETWLRRGIALSLLELGRPEEALVQARLVDDSPLPHDLHHPDLTRRNDTVGQALLALGLAAEAETAFSAALAAAEAHFGAEHPALAWSLSGIGRARAEQGAFDAAVEPLRRALALWSKTPRANPAGQAQAESALTRALEHSDRPQSHHVTVSNRGSIPPGAP